jgi:asparagine synthase (glutamine-hydrolysing)
LQAKGHVFRSETDTEVILAAFVEWGERCLDRFNGMWAFAIWDTAEKRLFLSRDRFGKKPLFYTTLPSGFAFGSEMKALFPLMTEVRPNIPLIQDTKRILFYEATDECVIQGIKRFPAGHFGWWKAGALTIQRWWCTLDHLPIVPDRYEEQVEQLRSLFLDACRLRMRSDVPIGTALSGGLDSSSTISAMSHIARHEKGSRMSNDWQHAFVACFPNTPLDESKYARMVTDHLWIQATFVDIDPVKSIDRLYEYLYLFEDKYITSPIPFMMTYGIMRPHSVNVTIDGHGADELFAGYAFDYMHAFVDAKLSFHKAGMILDTIYDSYHKDSSQFHLPPKWLYWLKWRAKHIAKKILKPNQLSYPDMSHPRWKRLDNLNRTLYASTHVSVLPTLLRNYDRYSMANGVEIRMPFMDHRVVSFAFAISWTSKIQNGFSKSIVRDAMAPYLPHAIAYRKSKIGFNSPIVDWMQGPLKSFFLDAINSSSFKNCELIDPVRVAEKILRAIQDPHASFNMGEAAWNAILPYFWEQAVIKRSLMTTPGK